MQVGGYIPIGGDGRAPLEVRGEKGNLSKASENARDQGDSQANDQRLRRVRKPNEERETGYEPCGREACVGLTHWRMALPFTSMGYSHRL